LDLAVAQGAAYYGVVRRGGGIRIGGGTARSFYVGLETRQVARPWMCVVARDAQEGDETTIDGHDFDLLMGQPVVFPLASSSVRPDDRPGDLVVADPDSIRELPPLQSLMRVGRKAKAERVPVSLAARVTEVGTIELWCQSRTDARRWRLQIQLRSPAGQPQARAVVAGAETDRVIIEQSELDAAIAAIRDAFGASAQAASSETGPARLIKRLEDLIDVPRDQWPPSALRAWWEPLRDLADQRLKSPQHESRWFNLAGFALRPGRGYPLDELRLKALWPVFHQGVKHTKDVQCWAEWWILWRRVAAGPSPSRTSSRKCGAAPPAWSGWLPRSRRDWGGLSSRSCRDQPHPVTCSGAWDASGPASLCMDLPTPSSAARPSNSGSTSCSPGNTRPAARPATQSSLSLSSLVTPATVRATCPTRCANKCWPVSNSLAPTRPSSAPSASTTSWKPPRRASPWATPCRSACGYVKRINNPPRLLILRRADSGESFPR